MGANRSVGVIGLGLMGTALATRLSGAGLPVVGTDIDRGREKTLIDLGGAWAASGRAVAERCERLFVAVLTIDQVEAVVEDLGTVAAKPGLGSTVVFCAATCPPERVAALAGRAARDGIVLLDTPVSGTRAQVTKGDGLGLIAGDRTAVERHADALDAVYPRWSFLGAAGDASKAKLAINLILGLHRAALAEGLVFAERLGLDPGAFLEVARQSAAYSQVMDVKGHKMVKGDYAPQGKITQNLKDVTIMLDEARRVGQELPLGGVFADILRACVAQGEGERDNCAIIEELRRRVS